jgi:hypothetical protein
VVTDAAAIYPAVLDELIPSAWHHVERHANNPIEADHSQLKQRLQPMHGLQTDWTAKVIIAGHTFCKTFAADTTKSPSMRPSPNELPLRSPSCPRRSDLIPPPLSRCGKGPGRPTAMVVAEALDLTGVEQRRSGSCRRGQGLLAASTESSSRPSDTGHRPPDTSPPTAVRLTPSRPTRWVGRIDPGGVPG